MVNNVIGKYWRIEGHLVEYVVILAIPLLNLLHVSRKVSIHKTDRRVIQVEVYANSTFVTLRMQGVNSTL
jgi:hypothetical protein